MPMSSMNARMTRYSAMKSRKPRRVEGIAGSATAAGSSGSAAAGAGSGAPGRRRLLHEHLIQRIEMEEHIMHEAPYCLLFMWTLVFVLASMVVAFDTEKLASVHRLLSDSYALDSLADVKNAAEVVKTLERFAANTKGFYPVSPDFIPLDQQEILHAGITTFTDPDPLPKRLQPRIYEAFSFTAWVRAEPNAPKWILRKMQTGLIESAPTDVCWGWQAGKNCFVFGQHDANMGSYDSGKRPEPVKKCASQSQPGQLNLEAIVVNGTNISFVRNGVFISESSLGRRVTDCHGHIEIGDAALVMGNLNYYPYALTVHEVAEIYQDGAPLSEVVTGGSVVREGDRMDKLELQLTETRDELAHAQRLVKKEVLDLQSASALFTKESMVSLEKVITLEKKNTLLLSGAKLNVSAPTALFSGKQTTQVCVSGKDCTLNVSNSIKSMHIILPTATCGHKEAVAVQLAYLGGAKRLLPNMTNLGIVPTTAVPASYRICGSLTHATTLVEHKHLLGTLIIRARDWAYLLKDTRKFTQTTGAFNVPDPFQHDLPNMSISAWVRQTPENIGFYFGKQYQANERTEPIGCWSVRYNGLLKSLRAEGTAGNSWCKKGKCANCKPKMFVDGQPQCTVVITHEPDKPKQCLSNSFIGVGTHYKWNQLMAFSGEMRAIRMYNRVISLSEVTEMSTCKDPDVLDDMEWSDPVGHSCQWYDEFHRNYGYSACDAATKVKCPIACKMVSLCPALDADFQIFDRQQKIAPPTLCLEKGYTFAGGTCDGKSAAASGPASGRRVLHTTDNVWSNASGSQRRRLGHIPTPSCKTHAEFTDRTCAFDSSITAQLNRRKWVDFTMYFWTKGPNLPIFGPQQFASDGSGKMTHCFEIFEEVLWAYNPSKKAWGSARPALRPGPDKWLMRALVVNRTHFSYFANGEFITTKFEYRCSDLVGLYFGPKGFNVDKQQILHSPFKFFARAIPGATLQGIYYGELQQFNSVLNRGPMRTNKRRNIAASIKIEEYAEKTLAFLTPVVFQERFKLVDCDGFSAQLQDRFGTISGQKCAWPYTCSNLHQVQHSIIKCIDRSGDSETQGYHFGRESSAFLGNNVWTEFLQIFDGNTLVRNGMVSSPGAFIDMRTKTLSVIAVFYTPSAETVSLLNVKFDMSLASVQTLASISHYPSITSSSRNSYLFVVTAAIGMGIVTLAFTVYADHRDAGIGRRSTSPFFEEQSRFWDEILLSAVIIYMIVQAVVFTSTRSNIEDTFGSLLSIDWATQDTSYATKVDVYYSNIETAQDLIRELNRVENFGFILTFVCLVRLVVYLAVHPRIAILPGVLSHAAHEMATFFIYFGMLYLVLAVLASYMFGRNNHHFATIPLTCKTQFKAILGSTDDIMSVADTSPHNPVAYVVYTSTFASLVLFMLLNLFLSIIVDSYMQVKHALATVTKECSISLYRDLVAIFYLLQQNKLRIDGWPTHAEITRALELMEPDEDGFVTEEQFNRNLILKVDCASEEAASSATSANPISVVDAVVAPPDSAAAADDDDDEPRNAIFDYYYQFSFLTQREIESDETLALKFFKYHMRYNDFPGTNEDSNQQAAT